MANEFIITDLVDKKAVQQLKELRLEFDSTKGSYVELAKELAQGVKTNPKTFDELSQKARNYTSLLEKLNKTQENMASIQAKQLTVLRQVSQQLNSMSSLQKLNLLFEQFAKNSKNFLFSSDKPDVSISSKNPNFIPILVLINYIMIFLPFCHYCRLPSLWVEQV